MYSKIIVPLDGSPLSETILPIAQAMAGAFNIPIEMFHAIDPQTVHAWFAPEHGRHLDVVERELTNRGREYLAKAKERFSAGTKIETRALIASPAEQILEEAAAAPDALVAMTTRGLSGVQRWLLGSTADKVLHGISNPLLLVKASDAKPTAAGLSRILVPLDGSGLAEKVLTHVRELAKAMDLHVEFLRAYSLPISAAIPAVYPPKVELGSGEKIRKDVEAYLTAKVHEFRESYGLKEVSFAVSEGEAAGVIIDTAQQTSGNLIAMSTHGRSGVGRWLLGSVADRVVRYSGDPVLLIRPGTDKAQGS